MADAYDEPNESSKAALEEVKSGRDLETFGLNAYRGDRDEAARLGAAFLDTIAADMVTGAAMRLENGRIATGQCSNVAF